MISKRAGFLFAAGLTAVVTGLGTFEAQANPDYVITDPNNTFYGYENVFTNGLTATTQPAYISLYLGSGGDGGGGSFPNNSSVDTSGNLTIGADDWPDVTSPYNVDTNIWADATGTSPAICKTLSDIYTQYNNASAGDSIIFTGTLVTNTLAEPYSGNAVIFIKDYDSSWGFHGYVTLAISTLTNGQPFSLTFPSVYGTGDFVQYRLGMVRPSRALGGCGQLRAGDHQHQWWLRAAAATADECLRLSGSFAVMGWLSQCDR